MVAILTMSFLAARVKGENIVLMILYESHNQFSDRDKVYHMDLTERRQRDRRMHLQQ